MVTFYTVDFYTHPVHTKTRSAHHLTQQGQDKPLTQPYLPFTSRTLIIFYTLLFYYLTFAAHYLTHAAHYLTQQVMGHICQIMGHMCQEVGRMCQVMDRVLCIKIIFCNLYLADYQYILVRFIYFNIPVRKVKLAKKT